MKKQRVKKKFKLKFDTQTITYTIGAGFFVLILNSNSDIGHIILALLLGFSIDRYYKLKARIEG